ncbi:MAG: PQQ-dependent sugar dehydrogenase [Bacteroidota bacterium]|nr:PQQ-dependent sugar dehydrogenase [Bacteroidota bacterium]
MNKIFYTACLAFAIMGLSGISACNNSNGNSPQAKSAPISDTNLKLPEGFSAKIIADTLGHLRHIVVNSNGDIYVNVSSLKNGNGIYCLSDTDKDGSIDKKTGFADYPGTGIAIKNGYLYSSSNSGVFRYKLDEKGEVLSPDKPEEIVMGLVDKKRDNSKSIAIDDQNNLYVTVGSYSDACRQAGSGKGIPGCPLLDSVGGIWEFKADKLNQTYSDAVHYARGIKNAVGIFWNSSTNSLFCTQHGRGQFNDEFPQYYTAKQSQELPAETVYELHKGTDAGWPFVYYDQFQKKKILAPEYGGDGKIAGDDKYQDPIVAFPAHLAPDDLMFYTGNMFPERYKNGAFIAFHGKSPELKKGYLVAFVPFKDGKPSGDWEIFADNFAGQDLNNPASGPIQYRPTGLAQGPDGSLYVTDDLKGTIFRITYSGQKM